MKLIILDRDGVINKDSDAYIKSPDEFIPLPGSLEAIARLKQAGYTIAVATNQSGIARGYYDETTLAAMHEKLARRAAGLITLPTVPTVPMITVLAANHCLVCCMKFVTTSKLISLMCR